MTRSALRTAELGPTGFEITRVGFGAWGDRGRWLRLGLGIARSSTSPSKHGSTWD